MATQISGSEKTQVKNYSAELFSLHFWLFEVWRFRNPTNKIIVA
jgi:hypothetical protein